jgi:iron(III) transport system permease protein
MCAVPKMNGSQMSDVEYPGAALGRRPGLPWDRIIGIALLAVTALMVIIPLASILIGALRSDAPGAPDAAWSLQNILHVYSSDRYLNSLRNTLHLAVVVAALSVVVGAVMAWIVARTNAPYRDALALLILIPLMMSNLITTLAWVALAAPNAGFINVLWKNLFGGGSLYDIYSFSGMVLVLVTDHASFAFVAFYAALRSMDQSLEEASHVCGAGPVRTAVKMTLPLIWPTVVSTFLMVAIMTSENFSVPTLLGSKFGFQTLPSSIFIDMTDDPSKPTRAAAAGTMLLWIALLGTWWQRRILAKSSRFITIGGKGGRSQPLDLGPMKWVATGFLCLFLLVGVVLPYAALLFSSFLRFLTSNISAKSFTLDNYSFLFERTTQLAATNTLLYAGVFGMCLAVLYVTLSYIVRQVSTRRSGAFVEYLLMIPSSIPAIVLAVGLMWAYVGVNLPIYGTATILLIGYFVRYIGLGLRQGRNALSQISPDLMEAARVSGAGQTRAMRDVTLPLLMPSIGALWTLLFMSLFTEISITILLYSSSSMTLPILLWKSMAAGYQTEAFAIAIVQAGIIFALIALANWKFGILRKALQ